MSASGKIADAFVFFGWKGVNVVRQWVKPSNPQSATQGDQRIIMGGTGRAVGEIKPSTAFAQQLIDLGLIPGGQTKQSFIVKYIVDHYLTDATAYASQLSACTGHTYYSVFQSSADDLGIVEFDLDYAAIAPYDKALGLYLIAKTAIALAFVGTPYTTALDSWATADIEGMVADMTGA
ncbi:MAG: hypothetical protein PHN89_04345 [Candidatus Pacebacteria bacterium]|nr:hypothetical protein [Candidatus Paceibacterota bacterium]